MLLPDSTKNRCLLEEWLVNVGLRHPSQQTNGLVVLQRWFAKARMRQFGADLLKRKGSKGY